MKILEGTRCYLSGPIEMAANDGIDWRRSAIDKCIEKDIKINFIDPTNKGSMFGEVQEIGKERVRLRELKAQGKFDEVRKTMKLIRRWDLRGIDYSDFIIVYVNRNIPTWGTVDECVMAERQKKPILAIVEGGATEAPDWLFAMMQPKEMFNNLDDLIDYIDKVNNGVEKIDKRWIFIK